MHCLKVRKFSLKNFDWVEMILKICLALTAATCSACVSSYKPEEPRAGYIFLTSVPFKSANLSPDGSFRYFIAPASKSKITLESRSPVSNEIQKIEVSTISYAKSWPHGGVQYFVQGYACEMDAGTYVPKKSNSNDWDTRFQTEPFGSATWQIWKYVCGK
jgi:hypothetical protein